MGAAIPMARAVPLRLSKRAQVKGRQAAEVWAGKQAAVVPVAVLAWDFTSLMQRSKCTAEHCGPAVAARERWVEAAAQAVEEARELLVVHSYATSASISAASSVAFRAPGSCRSRAQRAQTAGVPATVDAAGTEQLAHPTRSTSWARHAFASHQRQPFFTGNLEQLLEWARRGQLANWAQDHEDAKRAGALRVRCQIARQVYAR
jgi:hypothetical protein